MIIQENTPLAQYTNWRTGGPADFFAEVVSLDDLIESLEFARTKKIPSVVIGGGTNILVSDAGFRGLVIRNKMNTINIVAYKGVLSNTKSPRNNVYISSDAGVLVNRLVRYTLDQELSGLENFLGQPGTVGGATYINAHNMRKKDFFGDHIIEATTIDSKGTLKTLPQSYFEFGYDKSTIQQTKDVVV